MRKPLFTTLTFASLFLISIFSLSTVYAADSIEAFDKGASDFEFYMGYDGLGLNRTDGAIFGESALGYGVTDTFGGHVGFLLEGNGYFNSAAKAVNLGVYKILVDTDHTDFDLFLDFEVSDDGALSFCPSFEWNLDYEPDLAAWGFYLRGGLVISGEDTEEGDTTKEKTSFNIEGTAGVYYTISDSHQLLVEFDIAVPTDVPEGEENIEIGGIALGYNVSIHESVEFISQISLDLPQNEEDLAIGISLGLLATVP